MTRRQLNMIRLDQFKTTIYVKEILFKNIYTCIFIYKYKYIFAWKEDEISQRSRCGRARGDASGAEGLLRLLQAIQEDRGFAHITYQLILNIFEMHSTHVIYNQQSYPAYSAKCASSVMLSFIILISFWNSHCFNTDVHQRER